MGAGVLATTVVAIIVGHHGKDALVQLKGTKVGVAEHALHNSRSATIIMGVGKAKAVQQFVHDRDKSKPSNFEVAARRAVPFVPCEDTDAWFIAKSGRVHIAKERSTPVNADFIGVQNKTEVSLFVRVLNDKGQARHGRDEIERRLELCDLVGIEAFRGYAIRHVSCRRKENADLGVTEHGAPVDRIQRAVEVWRILELGGVGWDEL